MQIQTNRVLIATAAAAVVLMVALLAAAQSTERRNGTPSLPKRLTAQEMAQACASRARVQTEFDDVQRNIALLRQMIANYGFERTAAELNAISESLESGEARQRTQTAAAPFIPPSAREDLPIRLATVKPENMGKELYKEVVKRASDGLKKFIESIEPKGANELGAGTLQRYLDILDKLPMGQSLKAQLRQMAMSPSAQTRALGYTQALGQLETLVELSTSDDPAEIAWQGVMSAAGVISPTYGALLQEIDWAGKNLYDAVTGRWADFQIAKLTTMTDADLHDLREKTDRLAVETKRLALVRENLSTLPPCDSTQLANAPRPAPAAAPAPTPAAAPAAKKGGSGKGKWIGLAAAGGGGAGFLLWCKQQPWQNACSFLNGGGDDGGSYSGGSSSGGTTGGGGGSTGGGGGGGSANTQCLSTCSCTVSQISGSRTCTGSVQGSCTFPPIPVGGSAGAVCGQGSACKSGLACVNGRCTDIGSACR